MCTPLLVFEVREAGVTPRAHPTPNPTRCVVVVQVKFRVSAADLTWAGPSLTRCTDNSDLASVAEPGRCSALVSVQVGPTFRTGLVAFAATPAGGTANRECIVSGGAKLKSGASHVTEII